jgi:hypothetical protein
MFGLLLAILKHISDHEASTYWLMLQHFIWIPANLMNRIYKDSGTKQKNRINILASVRSRKGDFSVNRSVVRHPNIINICARKTFGRIKDTCSSLSHFKAKIPDFHDFTNIVMNHSKNHTSYCTTGIETFIDLDANFPIYHFTTACLSTLNVHNKTKLLLCSWKWNLLQNFQGFS